MLLEPTNGYNNNNDLFLKVLIGYAIHFKTLIKIFKKYFNN